MAVVVVVEPRADRMLLQIERYWSEQYGDSINPLETQFKELTALLVDYPELGEVVQRRRVTTHRFVLRCGWSVYYDYDRARQQLFVTAVWHSARGERPPI